MAVQIIRVVNFGKSRSGLSTVGYAILNSVGAVQSARTISGVYELTASSGIYAAFATFPENFQGSIIWDTGETPGRILYAAEQYNYLENNPSPEKTLQVVGALLSGSIITSGSIVSGSSTFNVKTNILASNDFYVGYVMRITDAVSGSADRPIDQYINLNSTGTFVVDPALPFIPTSGSQFFVLTQFSELYGRVG